MEVFETLNALQSTTKGKEKLGILNSLVGGSEEYLFKRVAKLTYEPTINYWLLEIDFPESGGEGGGLFENEEPSMSLDKALDFLEYDIAKRKYTGKSAYNKIIDVYNALNDNDKEVFKRVIKRDLLVGVATKTLNKVWPEMIYDHPYMQASSFNKKNLSKIVFPCFSQTKEDGEYEDTIIRGGSVEIRSRGGAVNNHHASPSLVNALTKIDDADVVLMGEILVFEDNTRKVLMPRKSGNGYLNSNSVDPERLLHVYWDVVPYSDFKEGKCCIAYEHRFDMLKRIVGRLSKDTDQVKIIDSRIVNSVDEIIDHFLLNVKNGLEGLVVKNTNMVWKSGKSTDQVKVKVIFDCDLKIVGFNQGKRQGKLTETLGSLICESSDGILLVNAGTGLSEEQRDEIWENQLHYLKTIVTIKSNDIISNETNPDKMSLFLPVVDKFRKDKHKADSYDRVVEQKDAFVETLKTIELGK